VLASPFRAAEPEWSRTALSPYPSYSVPFVDSELILGTGNGDIFVLASQGGVKAITAPQTDRRVDDIAANGEYLVGELISLNGMEHFLNIYYRETGGLNKSRKIYGEVTTIVPLPDGFLVGIWTGTSYDLYTLEPEEGVMTFQNMLDEGFVIGSAYAGADKVLLYTGQQIYLYDVHYNKLSTLIQDSGTGMRYDGLNAVIYCFSEDGIRMYKYPGGEYLGYHPSAGGLRDFHILYNK
jgi:hypothetical protein